MIRLDEYDLPVSDRVVLEALLGRTGASPSLEGMWEVMDRAWRECGCSNEDYDAASYAAFYRHPVWLLNGMFIEQDALSLQHRQAIAGHVARLAPGLIVDFGGGFGSLARMIAGQAPAARIEICDPFPPQPGVTLCRPFAKITFVEQLVVDRYDVLVSTDVLEHLHDPLTTLAEMVSSVRLGGHLLIANHFFPVIQCHIPSAFHLRYSFDWFCEQFGLRVLGPCVGSHATVYQRVTRVAPDWPAVRRQERRSRVLFPVREWREAHVRWWEERLVKAVTHPLYYPRKAWRRVSGGRP